MKEQSVTLRNEMEAETNRHAKRLLRFRLKDEIAKFVGKSFMEWINRPEIGIATCEGDMHARPNDWIIKGIKGEFYPCKPDIFEETYEPVD